MTYCVHAHVLYSCTVVRDTRELSAHSHHTGSLTLALAHSGRRANNARTTNMSDGYIVSVEHSLKCEKNARHAENEMSGTDVQQKVNAFGILLFSCERSPFLVAVGLLSDARVHYDERVLEARALAQVQAHLVARQAGAGREGGPGHREGCGRVDERVGYGHQRK